LGLHALLVAGLWQTWHAVVDAPPPFAPVSLRLVREAPVTIAPMEEPKRALATPANPPAARRKPHARSPSQPPEPPLAIVAPNTDAPSPAPTASAAVADEKLRAIDPDSITRAARAVVRGTTLARESDRLIGKTEAPTSQERLAAGMARSATKDCLKGSMDGNGGYEPRIGGLFEIPFLIYDAATGKCRR